MIDLPAPIETRLIHAALDSGQNLARFLETLLDEYEDQHDIKQAEIALKEEGSMSLKQFRAIHGV